MKFLYNEEWEGFVRWAFGQTDKDWIAIDENGEVHAYEEEVKIEGDEWLDGITAYGIAKLSFGAAGSDIADWRDCKFYRYDYVDQSVVEEWVEIGGSGD